MHRSWASGPKPLHAVYVGLPASVVLGEGVLVLITDQAVIASAASASNAITNAIGRVGSCATFCRISNSGAS